MRVTSDFREGDVLNVTFKVQITQTRFGKPRSAVILTEFGGITGEEIYFNEEKLAAAVFERHGEPAHR